MSLNTVIPQGPFESNGRKQLSLSSCGWVLIRSGQLKITGPAFSSRLGVPHACPPVAATTEVSTTATAMPEIQGMSAGVGSRRGRQGWCSSADDGDNYQGTGSFSQPPPAPDDSVPTTPLVSLPPGFQSLPAPRCRQVTHWLPPSRLPAASSCGRRSLGSTLGVTS